LRHYLGTKKSPAAAGLFDGPVKTEPKGSVANVDLTPTGDQFHLENLSPLFHDSLLFSKPAFEGYPLSEEGVVHFPLGPSFFGAGNAGSDFEKAHGAPGMGGAQLPRPELM
jgi:hypothetical protein